MPSAPVPPTDLLAIPIADTSEDRTLRSQVADRLIAAIAIGDCAPGTRLPPERELAAALHVGRVTVRGAIARLHELGLVRSQPGRGGGTFVADPSSERARESVRTALTGAWSMLLDQHEAEGWLHGAIAAAAAERHTALQAERMLDQLGACRIAGSGAPAREADKELHLAIGDASNCSSLVDALTQLESRMHLNAPFHPWGDPEGWEELELRSLADHERLVEAILRRDVPAAHTIGRTHARINLEILEAAMRRASSAP